MGMIEEDWVEGLPQPDRRLPVSSIGGALVKEACSGEVAFAEKCIGAGHERHDLRRG